LNADDSKDEKNEKAEQQDIAEHGQRVEQEHHQYPHA
jgi:hypothetical protein